MDDIIVFAGPTISAYDPDTASLDVTYLGPAAQGDIYRASKHRPWAIVLIDGYFDFVPPPWHRELLWAMSSGIHVFGAASIGALRAAELTQFGMIGVGEIYEKFASGALTDDDEVAVVHGPPELGYPLLSMAMVDIRATLEAAVAAAIVSGEANEKVLTSAKRLNFRQRTAQNIFRSAKDSGVPSAELSALETWWPHNIVEGKRRDAIEAIRAAGQLRRRNPEKFQADFIFQATDPWLQFVESQKEQIGTISNPLRL